MSVLLLGRTSTTRSIARSAAALAFVWSGTGIGAADAQTTAPSPATVTAVDFNFVGQANLGAPFQVDSGLIAEKKGSTAAIRSYAHLMVATHIPVEDALNSILQAKQIIPSNMLLHGAYAAMLSTLQADQGLAFDGDYVNGQIEYQKANAALFRHEIEYGSDPDLKEFARQTLPKIEDHLQRALQLAGHSDGGSASR